MVGNIIYVVVMINVIVFGFIVIEVIKIFYKRMD